MLQYVDIVCHLRDALIMQNAQIKGSISNHTSRESVSVIAQIASTNRKQKEYQSSGERGDMLFPVLGST